MFADWGRAAGLGSSYYKPGHYDPAMKGACPANPAAPFYISIDPKIDSSAGPFDKKPDDKCVVDHCKTLSGDPQQNCEGATQPLVLSHEMSWSIIILTQNQNGMNLDYPLLM